jgi:guanylate kinase
MPVGSPMPEVGSPASGKLIVITGPSGVGKGTLLAGLRHRHPDLFFSISATTRSPRPGEIEGQSYYFVSRDKFQAMVAGEELLEWAEFAGNFYGTPRQAILNKIQQGQLVILEIELQGARQVRQTYPEALQIFILPPSFSELEQRLRSRAQDSDAAITRRLETAKVEIAAAKEFDRQIINGDLETALSELEKVLFPPKIHQDNL